MTAPADRWVRASDWARIASLLGLVPAAAPAAVITALEHRHAKDVASGVPAARVAAIKACHRCDPSGWELGPDGRAADLARRCDHRPPTVGRDITEPMHEPTDAKGNPA